MFRAIVLLFASLFLIISPATAQVRQPQWQVYNAAQFAQAQKAGKTLVVDIYADWCPTCRAQGPILDRLRSEAKLKNAVFVKVDFDKEKAFLREHRIPRQSTILVFKGRRETARSIAETNPQRLRAAVLAGA